MATKQTEQVTSLLTQSVWDSERYERRVAAIRRQRTQARDKRGRWK